MSNVFFRQFFALCVKNFLVLWKRPLWTLLNYLILPIGLAVFLGEAKNFLFTNGNITSNSPFPVQNLADNFDPHRPFFWVDDTNSTAGFISADDIVSRITANFSDAQRASAHKLSTVDEFGTSCPQNLNGRSLCWAALSFQAIPPANNTQSLPFNYTIHTDLGLTHVDTQHHRSDVEVRILPLQWAVDQAIIELKTGKQFPVPLEWGYPSFFDSEDTDAARLGYLSFIAVLLVLVYAINFIGIAYQLPGAFAKERATLLTAHLKAMGLLDSARILSWLISFSLAYLPAWIVISLIWHTLLFTSTPTGVIFLIHLLLGLNLATFSLFIAVPFGKSSQLAAVCSVIMCFICIVIGTETQHSPQPAPLFSILFPPSAYD